MPWSIGQKGLLPLALAVMACGLQADPPPEFTPGLESEPAGLSPYDGFGSAVAWLDDSTIAVGVRGADGGGAEAGAVRVLEFVEGGAQPALVEVDLLAGETPGGQFGAAIASSGSALVISSPYEDMNGLDNAGVVRVYLKESGEWQLDNVVVGNVDNALFGAAVDAAHGYVLAGGGGSNQAEVVLLYIDDGDVYEVARFTNEFGSGARFGAAVAIAENNRLAIGAPGTNGQRGSVAIYEYMFGGKGWQQTAVLEGAGSGDRFGEALEFAGRDRLLVSSPGGGVAGLGQVEVIDLDGDSPVVDAVIEGDRPEFGSTLAFDPASDLLAVAWVGADFRGGVRVFRLAESVEVICDLNPAVSNDYQLFGRGLGVRQGRIAAGAPFRDGAAGTRSGACYLAGFAGDCDGDQLEDAWQLAAGLAEDCNENQVIDACDIANGSSSDSNDDGVPDECEDGPCGDLPWDINANGSVGGDDLGLLLVAWGPCQDDDCPADFTGDGVVSGADLGLMLGYWGDCTEP